MDYVEYQGIVLSAWDEGKITNQDKKVVEILLEEVTKEEFCKLMFSNKVKIVILKE